MKKQTFSKTIRAYISNNMRHIQFSSYDFKDICSKHGKEIKSATQILLTLERIELITIDGYITKQNGGPNTKIYRVKEGADLEPYNNYMTPIDYSAINRRRDVVMHQACNKINDWLDGIEKKRLCNSAQSVI